jgi:four helix bundle suffix protein
MIWSKDSLKARAMRDRLRKDRVETSQHDGKDVLRLTGLTGLPDFVARADPELAGNAMLCAVNQATYLLRRQIESQARRFLEDGGFTENLYHARIKARSRKRS